MRCSGLLSMALTPTVLAIAACSSPSSPDASTDVLEMDAVADLTAQDVTAGDLGVDAATDVPSDVAPIVAPADQWTWIDFPESRCANGSPTGLAVNPHPGSTRLLVYLHGGGACNSAAGCWGANPTASNLDGYGPAQFTSEIARAIAILQRSQSANPFADANMVFVPYCTGDLHAGFNMVTFHLGGTAYPTYFWGAHDLDLFLERLVPTFSNTTRVILAGTSAGGFGTLYDYDRVHRAFGVRVDIIDDSGPPLAANPDAGMRAADYTTWGVTSPLRCPACMTPQDFFAYQRQTDPASRVAFLSYAQDTLISPFLGLTQAEFEQELLSFSSSIASDSNARILVDGSMAAHVVENTASNDSFVLPWLTQMANDDASWTDLSVGDF